MEPTKSIKVLMVCMGNICRSPTAEAVLRRKIEQRGLHARVSVDSAGTHDYHVGCAPDARAQAHARRRGYELGGLRARHLAAEDFEHFDLVLVMDGANLEDAAALCPPARRDRLQPLMAYAAAAGLASVPDPYYGDAAGFEQVLDLVEQACDGLVEHLAKRD